MNIKQFIFELSQQGVKLRVEGEQLRIKAPKGVLTAETRDLIAKNKAELISLLEQKNAITTNTDLALTKVARNQKLSLSFAQERIWLLSQLEPDNPFYNELVALQLHGNLNIVALEQSLNKIIARHETLRTNFRTTNEQPVQVIAESLTLSVPVVDLTEVAEEKREIACQKLATAEATRPFDLASSPLIRASVVKLTEVEHVLLLTIHHIVFDGWSTGVLIRELASIYSALCNNSSPELPELPIQYADFAIWQRQLWQTEVLQTQLHYWKQLLKNAPTLLELPTDRPRPAVQTFRGARQHIKLSIELSEALANFSKQERATLFMTLFTAYVTLLYRYTGSDDIVVGTPIANRDRSEIEGLIGFFVNTLVLRTDLSGNPSFGQLLSRVRQRTLEAYAYPDLPFEELVKVLQPERDLSHTPLFQVMFAFQNVPVSGVELTGLTVSSLTTESETAKFDLTLLMQNTATGLVGMWEYNTDLFDASTIERITGHFVTLLEGILANPQQPISQLPLLTEVEQQQLLVEWNDTQADYPQDLCIHQLFEEQVQRTPDAVAVVFEDQQLTYHQLNCRANQLAHYLRSLGVGAEVLVGICVERSLEMVVGLLGILKAGGAYVPLDPEYPIDRLRFMLEDSQVSVLLTQQRLVEQLPQHQAQLVCLDTDSPLISQFSQDNVIAFGKATSIADVQATNLAYVIYTSGSTGQPKGVLIAHQGLVNLVFWHKRAFKITSLDKATQLASTAFDAAVWELWPYLTAGASIYLAKSQLLSSLENLQDWLISNNITIGFLPTPVAQELLSLKWPTENLALRTILTGGDKLHQYPSDLIPFQIVNNYGPTENTVVTTSGVVVAKEQDRTSPTIGRAIANTQVYILDSNLQPVPVGVPGELHIAGVGLARGYLNHPELTQEKFIFNPFGSGRLYKTGDKARYLPDGNIEYIERTDNQVKIRGFRIELGEIEAALSQHSDVQISCVIPREDTLGDKRLVAYVVAHQDCTPTTSELRQVLKAKLPEYMIPNAFVMLESLPLTPNGKVDRRALPAPDLYSSRTGKYVAPRTPIEELLAQIWAQVLKIVQVGIHDNFFELGGHSLLATQLVSRIRNIFKVELALRELFARATVAELAQEIEQLQQQDLKLSSPPILPKAKNAQLPLSYAQQRLWFLDQFEPNSAFYNIPLALRLVGTLHQVALEQSLYEIITRHEALRTNFVIVDGQSTQIIQTQTNWTLSIIDWQHLPLGEQESTLQQLVQQHAIQPFDLASEPLIRATLIVLSETEHVLSVCMHHIVSDGWSIGVFIQELAALYNAYSQGQTSPLTPLPIQYADFAIWQRQWLQGDILQSQLNYWQQQLKDAPALLSLPTDRPRPAVQTFAGAHQEFAISVELTGKLTKLSQEQGVTLFMTLLAAYDTLLYRYTGQSDILVGSPIANRNRSEIEELIGFFVNTLVMRTSLAGNPSFSELLGRVRDMAMDAYAHQDLPFEMLVEALQPERNLSHTPLFQVMFVLQNAPMSGVELAGLTISSLSAQSTTAKFDLSLLMQNTATGLVGVWEYNTDLFDSSTIERITGHFMTLLEGIVNNPEEKISQLPMLTQVEQQLLVEWNNTQADYLQDKCIYQWFQEQVERTPDAVAVVFENQQLTYRQLNCRANQLAHYLQTLGVKSDVLVGICIQRSLEMVVALLGILKAGGAYVPLDPEYPTERLSFMLEDAQVAVLLTQHQLLEKLSGHQAQAVCLDTDAELISQSSQDNLISSVQTTNLAYVIYTSGSTGQPKGVAMNQLALNNLILWQLQNNTISTGAKTLQFAPISFDVSFQEMFTTWLSGGTLFLITEEQRRDSVALLGFLQEKAVERLFVPFVALQQLAEVAVGSELVNSHLKEIITAGEQLQITGAISQWLSKLNDCTLHNHYGPSESHVVTTFTLPNSVENWPLLPPIGRPIANTQIYILDRFLQFVPVGVPGELYIGGVSLARGYLNRPELTQEKFIPNPFARSRGAGEQGSRGRGAEIILSPRLYKTGDLARYLPDGNIEYLGRIDNQVKIRGFRIELGEIEAVLSQYSHIQASCAIAREDIPGDKRLVAYIVPHPEVTPIIGELRQFLKGKLPEYMLPNAIVILEALPLTPNGKVDRRALRAPDLLSELSDKYVAPRTPIEELLAQIWAQVLKVEQVGIHNNFFELGGHSLLATQVVSRIRNIFKVELPLRELFATATVAELAQSIEQLQQQDLELSAPPIFPRAKNKNLPLSYAQQRLWFLDQFEPNSPSYNIPAILRLGGNLNQAALEQSLQEIIHRHEALRTNFVTVNGQPNQIIHTKTNWTVSVVEYQHLPTTEQESALHQLVQQQATQPFDLASEALIRATLVVLKETEHILLVCMHHIVSDAWSMGVFVQELATLYNTYSQGQPSLLAPLAIQYADFAIWQRQWLQGDVLQSQLNYWQQQLKDAPALLSLPTDRPRPAVQTFAGAYQQFALSQELTQKLTQLSQQQGVTLFMTLLAAYDTLLYRYTGVADILVGSPIANRDRSEIEGLIGFFVNTLVMRTNLAGNPSFSELLTRVREMTMEAYTYQNLPFEMLVEALQPERDISHTPLFQVMFVLQNAPMSQLELTGLTVTPLITEGATAKFDLTLSMQNTASGLVGVWEYNTDLFDASTIKRMSSHFVTLLEGIVTNPQQQISQLPLLTEVEQQQLLVEWNNTQVDYSYDKCIHQLFEEQVQRTPDGVAVVFEDRQLTYQQLNCRANQLAHYLQSLGVKPDVLVGLCVERSLEMVVGLLGILKAGGAYVPLDPEYPQERLSFMLQDAQVPVLLTQQQLLEKLPQHQAEVVCLDTDWQFISQSCQDNALAQLTVGIAGVQANNLAYVIYTSGSTGKPKGVMVSHRNLCNHMFWMQATFPLTEADKVLQKTPFSFDASVWEFYAPLLVGGQLLLAQPGGHADTAYLLELIAQGQVTTVQFVPSLLQILIEQGGLETCQSLKQIFCGGESLPVTLQDKVLSNLNVNLHNLYGPTEACIDATFWTCKQEIKRQVVPIGRAIANTQVYILDEYLQPVPIGVPGELHIGGAGLARGYLNRPELTKEKFIPNPFSDQPHSRLYKTSDLARYLPDGTVEYLGRIDNQVKIRGFRIELGEIEAVINTHPQIQQAVVIVREDIPGNKRLVAYVVTSDESLTTNQLRQFLKQQLPEYMVPSGFVTLDNLPLTPNGKIDRKALPTPDGEISREHEYVAPRTPIEQILTNIWQQLLLKEKVSIHDNFFEIGGDSILSIQIVSRAKNSGIQITPKQIFQNQTIAELAKVANTTVSVESKQGIVTGVAPLTPIQHWFFEQNKQESHHYNQSVLLQIPNNLQSELIEIALKKLLEHHDALRLKFTSVAAEHKQINQGLDDRIPFAVVNLSSTPRREQPQALEKIALEYQESLNLSTGPIMQVVMFNLGNESDARLLIIIHHLAVDGVSWRILLSDLQKIYQQLISQKPIELSPKTTAFIDWAEKLNNYAQSEIIKLELDYWLNQPWSKIRPLPSDYADIQQENTVGSAACVSVKLSQEETQTLLLSVNEAYNTQINDILLSALVLSIAEWTENSTVLIGLEGHGREEVFADVDLSRTVGWFTSLFPVLLQLPSLNQPGEIIKSIKEQLRAIPNRGIGYGILRYLCKDTTVKKQIQKIPASEISFNYLGQFDQVQSETGWKFAPESTGASQSLKQTRDHLFDINALVVEGELLIDWTYDSHVHTRATVEKLAQSYIQGIRSIIEHCQLAETKGYTPSDFPDVQLNQLQLDELLARFQTKNIESIYPLSPSQQGMLFETLSAFESGIHLEQCILNLQEELDSLAFEKAWQRVVDRHSIFRTAFIWEAQDRPLQIVLKGVKISLEQQDWRGLSLSQQQEKLEIYLSADRLRGLEMTEPPLMRLALFQVNSNAYQFVWTSHHILTDGWCVPLIFKEVFAFYEAFSKGQDLFLEPSHPYRNYITWLKQQDLSQAEAFWRGKLQGFKSPTPLGIEAEPVNFSAQEERYGEQKTRLTASATAALQSLLRQHHLTLNILVHGVWALLLSRYSSLKDVVFGATVSGRPSELVGAESMLGLFINTLPMRLQVTPQASLWSWLKDIQEQSFTQRDYEYCSEGQIHEWSEVAGSLPLYESLLVFQNYPVDSSVKQSTHHDMNQPQARSIGAQTKYALTILVSPSSELEFCIIYNRYRYENPAITQILEHFQALLNSIVDLPEQQLGTLIERISADQIPQVRLPHKFVQKEQRKSFDVPQNLWELQLVQIWEDILDIHPVSIQDNFFELGGHSLLAVRLMSRIQKHFQINLPLAILFQNPTIEQLAYFLGSSTDSLPWPALVPIKTNGNQSPLFCIHPGGGNVLCYHHIAYYLSSERPFYALQSVGLNPQNQPHTSIEQMATHYIQELQTVQPHGPYFLSGWSFGGLVAFEMAQQLSRQGEQIALLALLDSCPPSLISKEPIDNAALLVELFKDRLDLCLEQLRQFELEEQLIYIVEQAKQKNIVLEGFDVAQAPHLLKISQINAQAAQNYKPQYYSGSIVLFKASETDADLEYNWGELVEHIKTDIVPGNHQDMVSPPYVQTLVQKLQKFIEQATDQSIEI
ncbi:MAG: amino acid adenylation domain-containing protein [Nostoc sp. ChiSLP01]|nr:amino acid adenylation domain-containing protein [Nostoc sp. CmiSLP01]